MDLQMPGLDGLEAAATIRRWERAAGGHLPIIGMSASSIVDEQERCREAGMDRFVSKPIGRERLFRTIEELAPTSSVVSIPPELAGLPAFLAGLGGDAELARKLVDIFVAQSTMLMDRVTAALEAGDAVELRRAAHALKGTISNFPAGPARALAARMERLGQDGDLDAARDTRAALEHELDRLRTLLPTMI
jgi:CheY-like chemotaxis protein